MKVITEQPESPECLGSVARFVWTHPWQVFVRRWNWKAAVLSAVFRGLLFGLTMTSLGGAGAARGIWVEIGFRILVGGFWGSLLQAFRAVRPAWVASMTVAVALPAAAHALEFAALRAAAAEHIGTGMAVSISASCARAFSSLTAEAPFGRTWPESRQLSSRSSAASFGRSPYENAPHHQLRAS
jgi:hypothetical protein